MNYARKVALLSREKHAFNTVILRVLSRIFVLRFHYDTRETYFTRAPPAVVLARARGQKKSGKKKKKKSSAGHENYLNPGSDY